MQKAKLTQITQNNSCSHSSRPVKYMYVQRSYSKSASREARLETTRIATECKTNVVVIGRMSRRSHVSTEGTAPPRQAKPKARLPSEEKALAKASMVLVQTAMLR